MTPCQNAAGGQNLTSSINRSDDPKKVFAVAAIGMLIFSYLFANFMALFSNLPINFFVIFLYFVGIAWAVCASAVTVMLVFHRNLIIK
ncbi:hypothetical protein [Methanoregula sp.]|uniref:hypothetical protein n=1 Tax=Methanoregula sp. TaxID=2052170 RepID=UPI002D7F3F88|nr:hypothetical protein [Methanoregula sp.]